MILEKDSSVLGYPGEISKPLDADHHGVCKFDNPEDFRYITVRNVLKSLVGKAKPKGKPICLCYAKSSNDVDETLHTDALQESGSGSSKLNFEQYLSVPESLDGDYNFFRDRWTSGTCKWILAHEAFTAWLDDTHCKPRVLWIHGNAASGKSVLSSFIIDYLMQLGLPCHYFFIRFLDQQKRGLNMILRCLACQLAHSTPAYADRIRMLEAAATDLRTADFRNIWQWLYKQILFHLDIKHPLYWIIDGMDEADNPGLVIKLLSELHSATIPLRVLIVSRKTHGISSAFQKLLKLVHLEVLQVEGSQDDFRSYINHEMDVAREVAYKEEVTARLLERARGNFLWIHLAVSKINNCHTKAAVEDALKDLPPGMEALYDRMAVSVQSQPNINDRNLGQSIIGWATCAQRLLSIEELSDALGNDDLLDIHRTIGDLCGGFVVVDKEGEVAMIHETARDYLIQGGDRDRPFGIDRRSTHDALFKRCILRLTDPSLRSKINRHQTPALLDYATNTWFIHLSLAPVTNPDVLDTTMRFLGGSYVLRWIQIAADRKELRVLVVASRYLADVIVRLRRSSDKESLAQQQAMAIIEGWATDLVKIVGKFGHNLNQKPDSIYRLISPFCPAVSITHQQFGRKESRALHVSGTTSSTWDDCLARFSMEQGVMASAVIAAGNSIVILTNVRKLSHIIIYNSTTFEEQRQITHPERVFGIQINNLGDLLVSYGYMTTRVWKVRTGECIKIVNNPVKRPRPQTLSFVESDNAVLVGSEDRCIRSFCLGDESAQYDIKAQIDEQSLEDTMVNFPMCSAISPDGNMAAFGYRGHPVTAWELEPPMLLGQCSMALDATDMTIQGNTWGEVFRLTWHPFSGEVLGLTQVGLLFKWDPYEEEPNTTVQTGADYLTVSGNGSLIATGDAVGTIKVYATADLSLLYQLSSSNTVFHLCFSTDSRRLYDIRGTYGNVWEPNTLVRLADSSIYSNHNSETLSETESLTKLSVHTERHSARVDNVIALSGQSVGPLYCYGTEDGVAVLCEVGRGKVDELVRLTSYMSIEQIAWSEDGKVAAIVDLSGKLSIKRIAKAESKRDTWRVSHEFDLVVPTNQGHVDQLLFRPAGHLLFASTATMLCSVDLDSHKLNSSRVIAEGGKVKWINHPILSDYLLGFGNTKVHVLTWADLQEVGVYTYIPFRAEHPATTSSPQSLRRRVSSKGGSESLGRLVSHIDSPHVLLEISSFTLSGPVESQYLVFNTADIDLSLGNGDTKPRGKKLSYTLLPTDIASRIREPLAFISQKGLVFLDVDRWVCTWRLASSAPERREVGRDLESGIGGIDQYYSLPGDWVTADEVHLCVIMADGTLLCPRNGEVAAVQCAKLRK